MPSRTLALVCALLVGAGAARAQEMTGADRQGAVTRIWSGARYHFAYWDRVQADWDSAFAASLAAAARPQSDLEFYRRLRRFVTLLDHSQIAVLPTGPAADRTARPPLEIASIEGRPFVMDYAENDEMRVARPQRLAEIVAVQGVPAERWITDSILPVTAGTRAEERWQRAVRGMLEGTRGTALHLMLRLPGGETRGASVTRSVTLNARWPLRRPALQVDTLPDRSVWVRLNNFDDPDLGKDFDRAFPDFAGVRGMVLDLRANSSATAGAGYALLARLIKQPVVTVRWHTPQYRAADYGSDSASPMGWHEGGPDTVRPRTDRPAYAGPLAALAGVATGGAAEDFLVALRNASRGPVIGEPTAGHGGADRDPAAHARLAIRGLRHAACVPGRRGIRRDRHRAGAARADDRDRCVERAGRTPGARSRIPRESPQLSS